MKKKLSLIASVLVLSSSSILADDCCLIPYIGVDAQYRYMNFRSNFGNNIFNRNHPQGNVYFGLRCLDYFGIEVGYEPGVRRTRNPALAAGEFNLGTTTPADAAPVTYLTTARINGLHANLMAFIPIRDDDFEAYVSVGVAQVRARYVRNILTGAGIALDNPFTRTFSQSKTIMRAGIGLQKMVSSNAGVRLGFIWENTSKFNVTSREPVVTTPDPSVFTLTGLVPTVRPRDSFIYSFGMFWLF